MNAINWFEIPAQDFDRAVTFYETVLGTSLSREVFNGEPNGIFPYTPGAGVGGAVVFGAEQRTSMDGAIVYLNTGTPDGLKSAVSRVAQAGGAVLMPATNIGEVVGWFAIIRDSEGNRVGLHAPHAQ